MLVFIPVSDNTPVFRLPMVADVTDKLFIDTLPISRFVPTDTDWLGNTPPNGVDIYTNQI